jgi:hypothetical protein
MGCSWSAVVVTIAGVRKKGRGFGRLIKGGVALAQDSALKRLRGLLRSIFLIELDPALEHLYLSP